MTSNPYVVLSGVVGSTAYGMAGPDSDIDMKGIYIAPTVEVLGLDGQRITDETKSLHEGDSEYHELGKYIKLALKVNPTVTELMYLDKYETLDEIGQELISRRRIFLSEPAIRGAYGAYAKAQADRLMNRMAEGKDGFASSVKNRTEKHGRHTMRLLLQGTQLLKDQTLTVHVGDKRDWIFEMGHLAAQDPEGFYAEYEKQKAIFDATETKLPQWPDREQANEFLVAARLLEI